MKKFLVLVVVIILIAVAVMFFMGYFKSSAPVETPPEVTPVTTVQNPTKLFSTPIGATTTDGGAKLGVFVDERTMANYDQFYFPASFAVDKDLNTVLVLDSVKNRVAIFSVSGQYKGEIKLPFNLPTVDMAWFPKTQTIVLIFQDTPTIGVLKVDPAKNFTVVSSSTYNVPKVLGVKEIKDVIMNIWPVNITDTVKNSFVLSLNSSTLSDPVLVQTATSTSRVLNLDKKLKGTIGLTNKMAVVGYGREVGADILVQDLSNNQITKINLASSTGLEKSVDGRGLTQLQLVGTDRSGNIYLSAMYAAPTMESATRLFVYKLSGTGTVQGKVEVFFSPKMLTNRYIFIDQNGSIFYMHADDQKSIGFYEYKI